MRKIIILNKDHSIEMVKRVKNKILDKCEYLLVPIEEYDIGSFVMLKPNKYLSKFEYAKVSFSSIITKEYQDIDFDHAKERNIYTLDTVSKTLYSLVEFINYMHSLNKLVYINSLANAGEFEASVSSIKFSYFNIEIYDKKDLIYSVKLEYPEYQNLYPDNILYMPQIKKLYDPIIQDEENGYTRKDYIRIKNNKWKFKSNFTDDGIYGVSLFKTKSIYFTVPEVFQVFDLCKTLYCGNFQYNSHDYENHYSIEEIAKEWPEIYEDTDLPDTYGFRTYDVWYSDTSSMIEYIIHLKCIYFILGAMTEYETFQNYTGKITSYSALEIEPKYYIDHEIRFEFGSENILTIDEFIKRLLKEFQIN